MATPYPILHVPCNNPFMVEAKIIACDQPPSKQPYQVGSVIVKDGAIIGRGNNYNPYHEQHGCERRRLGTASGQDYHLCPGCDTQTHSEPRAIANAEQNGHVVTDAELYLYGHYHACPDCQNIMHTHGIRAYYVIENAEQLFNVMQPN